MEWNDWVILTLTAVLVGVGKVGFSGLSLLAISLLASHFGKASIGVLLPLLIVADIALYPAMRKHGSWKEVWILLPPTLIGMFVGLFYLKRLPEEWAEPAIGIMILMMLAVILWKKYFPALSMYTSKGFGIFSAIIAGISAMANAAGPVINIYFLAKNFKKMEIVSIGVRFFLLTNIIKLPMLASASLITKESLLMDLKLAPFVVIGVFFGKWLLNKVPQKLFGQLIIIFALIAAVRLFI